MNDSDTHVLFVVSEMAHYSEFKKILTEPKINSKINALLLFDRDGYDSKSLFWNEIADATQCGFKFLITPPKISFTQKNNFFRFLNKIGTVFPWTHQFLLGIVHFQNELSFYKKKLNYLKNLLHENHIDTIVLGEENVLLNSFLFKKSASERKVVIYPYTIPNPKEMAGGAFISASIHSQKGKFLKCWGGRWTRQFDEKIFLLLPFSKIFAQYFMGYQPNSPWILNSDMADQICLEGEKMASLYTSLGVLPSKISITGSLNDDIIAQVLAQKSERTNLLCKKYNLAPDRPLILIGFPPSQFPRSAAEFSSYNDLIQVFFNTLKPYLLSYSVLVSKHPRLHNSLDLLAQNGFVICDEPTIELIPLAQLYIASASATIRWAIAAGIPVINYDLYRYYYGDYENSSAVKTVFSATEFKTQLNRLLTDNSYYTELKVQQDIESKRWSHIDGHAADRILALITTKK